MSKENIKTKVCSMFMVAVVAGLMITPTFAQENDIREKRSVMKDKIMEQRCELVTGRIDARLKNFEMTKDKREELYKSVKERIELIITTYEKKGFDVSKLKADLVEWDSKIKNFWEDKAAMMNKLEETKGYACGNSEGEFREKLKEANSMMKTVRDDIAAIKDFYKNSIKVDVMELRNQQGTVNN